MALLFLLQVLLVDKLAQLFIALRVEGVQLVGQQAVLSFTDENPSHGNRSVLVHRQYQMEVLGRFASCPMFDQCAIHRQLMDPQVAWLRTWRMQRQRLVQGRAPGAVDFAFIENLWGAEL